MTSSCIVQKWCTCAPPRDPCGVRGVAAVFLKNEHSLSKIQMCGFTLNMTTHGASDAPKYATASPRFVTRTPFGRCLKETPRTLMTSSCVTGSRRSLPSSDS